jgi:murein DD-endopeptidase MepM/ murein hydrolase activator NlpD
MQLPKLDGFFCSHSDVDASDVMIQTDPAIVYLEKLRGRQGLSFDFLIQNRGDEDLDLVFLKAVAYNAEGQLLTYRYANRNAVGPSGIDTLGVRGFPAGETVDVYNPFHEWPDDLSISHVRYTFTFVGKASRRERYVGDVQIHPKRFDQSVGLRLPMRGLLTVIDAHDPLSHHRRFAMSLVRQATDGAFAVNFSRFAFDFAMVGEDGNLAAMSEEEFDGNRDFHFTDIRKSHTYGARVFAPARGVVVQAIDDLEDMVDRPFDTDRAIAEGRIRDIAGNRIVIKHSEREYSHLFHFMQQELTVSEGETVETGQLLGRIGFSGTATVYAHLHYQLMDGPDFMQAQALPVEFENVTILRGRERLHLPRTVPETGEFLLA